MSEFIPYCDQSSMGDCRINATVVGSRSAEGDGYKADDEEVSREIQPKEPRASLDDEIQVNA